MEKASPSPPNTKTWRSGRVSEMPLAKGRARPWMKCAPWACTKYGKRLEQPMPATVVIFSCHILRFSINLKYSASTEKSPQPGHHVGWSAAISFFVSPLRSSGAGTETIFPATRFGVSVKVSLIKIRLKFVHSGGDVALRAFEDFFHFKGEAVGFVDAANFRVAIARAQQLSELAKTVKSFVVHFHDEHVIETGENVFQAVRQRIDVADVNRRNTVTISAGAINGFLDRTFGRTPADEQNISFGRAVNFRHRQSRAKRLQFLAAFRSHLHMQFWRASRMTKFIVLQAGDNRIFSALNPRARRDMMR